jgi:hypothetical protein
VTSVFRGLHPKVTGQSVIAQCRMFQEKWKSEYEKTKFCCTSLRYITFTGNKTRGGPLRLTFETSSRANMRRTLPGEKFPRQSRRGRGFSPNTCPSIHTPCSILHTRCQDPQLQCHANLLQGNKYHTFEKILRWS